MDHCARLVDGGESVRVPNLGPAVAGVTDSLRAVAHRVRGGSRLMEIAR